MLSSQLYYLKPVIIITVESLHIASMPIVVGAVDAASVTVWCRCSDHWPMISISHTPEPIYMTEFRYIDFLLHFSVWKPKQSHTSQRAIEFTSLKWFIIKNSIQTFALFGFLCAFTHTQNTNPPTCIHTQIWFSAGQFKAFHYCYANVFLNNKIQIIYGGFRVCMCVCEQESKEMVFVLKRRAHTRTKKMNDCDLIRFRLTFCRKKNMVKQLKHIHTHIFVHMVTPCATHAACKSWFLHGNKSDKWYGLIHGPLWYAVDP